MQSKDIRQGINAPRRMRWGKKVGKGRTKKGHSRLVVLSGIWISVFRSGAKTGGGRTRRGPLCRFYVWCGNGPGWRRGINDSPSIRPQPYRKELVCSWGPAGCGKGTSSGDMERRGGWGRKG